MHVSCSLKQMQYSFTVNCGTLRIMRRPGFQIRFQIFLVSAADVNAYKSWSFEKAENKKKESPSYDPNPSFMFSHDLVLNSLVPPPECWSGPPLGRGCEGGGRSRERGGLDAPGATHQSAGSSVWRKSGIDPCPSVCMCIDQVDIYCTTDVNSSPLQG